VAAWPRTENPLPAFPYNRQQFRTVRDAPITAPPVLLPCPSVYDRAACVAASQRRDGTREGARTSATAYGQSSALCARAPRHRLDADAAPHGSIGTPARGGRASRPAGTRAALGGSAARLRTWGPRGAHGAGRPAARSPSEACPPVTLLLGSRTTGRWLPTATTTSALPHVRTGPFPGGTRAGPGTRGTSARGASTRTGLYRQQACVPTTRLVLSPSCHCFP